MAGTSHTEHWWKRDAAPGVLLLIATAISFALQNSTAHTAFDAILHAPIGFAVAGVASYTDLSHCIADGLMAVFFLYVGLELKRECVEGPLANPREAALPMIAALGGMAAPAAIYLLITLPTAPQYAQGWAIPAATDIAFALGALSLLGARAPAALRLFLLALAIVDDIGAILVIALFYTEDIASWALGGAALTFLAMLMMNRAGVTRLLPFWLLALPLWAFVAASGVHATIAGVLAALTVPMRAPNGSSPLIAAEHALKPIVLLGIMPIFALANAGAPLAGLGFEALGHPVTMGVSLGLLLGKPIGIVFATLIGARMLKLEAPAPLPQMVGISLIAGIGFTMSLFIGALAFGEGQIAAAMRIGVLLGSTLAALTGLALLARTLPAAAKRIDPA